MLRVLFAGGGTAGHINPALAIAGYVKDQQPDAEILYVGAKGGMEERLVPAAGFAFRSIVISGFQRKLTLKNIGRNVKTVARMFTSSKEAKKIIEEFRPDVCIGTGGYVSGPVIREAIKMNIPTMIHESNAFPGKTNKALSRHATYTLLAVEDAKKLMDQNANCVVTGNPVRQEVMLAERETSRAALGLDSRPVILSFGGSLGARSINEAVAELLVHSAKTKAFQHLHSYGQYGKWMPDLLKEKGVALEDNPQMHISEYIYNMPECLAAADLVICRAGAMTLSELQVQGKGAILIPSPNVAENHQYHNAMALSRRGAAIVIEEKDLTGQRLIQEVEKLFQKPDGVRKLGENARKMAITDTNARIYKLICELASR
ncbi:MAG: undecaprenyldiphospho-muramoylpentapeptide beta-N-acetylglucosaminyltransferase [Oscillospiraceae bacterium]|nr:undecaprenyldiphospho-muramoylpentapeptide beta-N-acetylglucosaminyltransferase [Oscillospiraceae bacterium]